MSKNSINTSNDVHSRKTTTEVLFFWTKKAIEETTLTQTHFSELLEEKDVENRFFNSFSLNMPSSEGQKILAANHKKMQRYLNYEVIMPADLVSIWCDCLPDQYRQFCKNQISSIFQPKKITIQNATKAIKELGDAISAIAGGSDKNKIQKEAQEAIDALSQIIECKESEND